ncbi:SusD/RagB family nutrient-binding outer membrane lipoprotein [Carboxylicivirga sp. N1Y90]|uniref:SusD/RagB family nutrient-binding outer membrane lipoprotein n=1 Tax=Carboxylicivirga fragile TaxID=3417571 RepID=UPI003D35211F|nr:SusD/RagB family nutrient-binding outer membrane lipoprotein [Marinilabiliaceae bacterium N1Y90]
MKSMKYILLALSILSIVSCDDFEDINKDPNNPPANMVPPGLKVGAILQEATLHAHLHQRVHNLYVDMFSQYYTGTGFGTYEYQSVDGWSQDFWNDHYRWFGNLTSLMLEYQDNDKFVNDVGLIKIWRAFIMHRAVDLFGDLPYFDVLSGEYDSEEEIYLDMLASLKEAVENMDEEKSMFNDIIYQGDVVKWKKFGNSLRLRLAMRVSGVDATTAKMHAQEAVASGVLEDFSDMPTMPANQSTWGEGYSMTYYFWWGAGNGVGLTETLYNLGTGIGGMEFLKDHMENPDDLVEFPEFVDPRLTLCFGSSSSNGEVEAGYSGRWTGIPLGLSSDERQESEYKVANNARINVTLRGKNGGDNGRYRTIMPIAEVWFLRAEGALNGWNMGVDTKDAYENGVRASFEYWKLDGADAYLTSSAVNTHGTSANWSDANGSSLEKIITQKYIGGYPDNSWEAWADLRRLELPKMNFGLQFNSNVPAGKIIQRVKYPSVQAQINSENYEKVRDKDHEGTKHWWAK